MRRLSWVFLISIHSIFLIGQNSSLADSLFNELKSAATDSTRAKLNSDLGNAYRRSNIDTAFYFYKQSLVFATKSKVDKLIGKSLLSVGAINFYKSNYHKADSLYQESLKIWIQLDNKTGICQTLANMGNVCMKKGDMPRANEHYLKSANLAEEIGDKYTAAGLYANIGIVCYELTNYDQALGYYKKSLSIYEELNFQPGISLCYLNMAQVYEEFKEYDKSIEYHNKSLKTKLELNDRNGMALAYSNLGRVYQNKGDYETALAYLNKAIPIYIETGNKSDLATTYTVVSEIKISLNRYSEAIKDGKQALNISKEIGELGTQEGAYNCLYLANKGLGKYAKALDYHELLKALSDSVFSESKSQQIIELQTRFESEQKEKENELLRIDNQNKTLILEKHRIISYALVGLIFILIIISLSVYKRVRDKKKVNNELNAKNNVILLQQEELSRNVSRLEETNEELQSQKEELNTQTEQLAEANATKDKFFSIIAHDLKNPFNSIVGFTDLLDISYDTLSDEKRKQYISLINSSAIKTFDLLTNLLIWARAQSNKIEINKESLNLYELIHSSISPYSHNAKEKGLCVENTISKDYIINIDKYTVSTAIGNIFSNAVKFTPKGGGINLNAAIVEGFYEISIEDTGVGMPLDVVENLFSISSGYTTEGTNNEPGTGLGLILCKEFIDKNKGKIEVESQLGEGTRFVLYLPIN